MNKALPKKKDPESQEVDIAIPSPVKRIGKIIEMNIADIVVVKSLYPREKEDSEAIARYRDAIDSLPPICVASGKESIKGRILVDGYHTTQAYKLEGRTTIKSEDLGELNDAEIFEEAILRNASHGHQLKREDKKKLVGVMWKKLSMFSDGQRTSYLSKLLSIGERTVSDYSKDERKTENEEKQALAKAMWLDCYTQEQIGKIVGVARETISDWVGSFRKLAEYTNSPESRQHFDVWEFTMPKDEKTNYFGAMPPQVVENLLWFYTEPGDIVFDPFAGSGTTINVAKRMGRPVWASDRKPYTELLPIHQHDIVIDGYPEEAPKQNVKFILLDPPYWVQAKGRYSDDKDDMGNMDLNEFMTAWASVVKTCANKLNKNGYLAFIVSPAELKDDGVTDLAHMMYNSCEKAGLKPERRIIVKYGTQQATGQQVNWARENKKLLKQYRDLVIFAQGEP